MCTVTIEDHTNLGQVCHPNENTDDPCEDVDAYRVRGRGECRAPARTPDGALITIGPFEFAAEVWWPR